MSDHKIISMWDKVQWAYRNETQRMTYEMAVARAFLQALGREPWSTARGNLATRTYALRRLRVRAGLVP